MAEVISYGCTDTAIDGVTPPVNLAKGLPNFAVDWAQETSKNGDVILKNNTSPRSQQERLRFSISPVANIYSGTGIVAAYQSPDVGGNSLLVQSNLIIKKYDDADSSIPVELSPIQMHTVVRYGNADFITADVIEDILARHVAAFYDSGSTATTRLNALIRGSLKPSEM